MPSKKSAVNLLRRINHRFLKNIAGDIKQYCCVKGGSHYILSVERLKKTETGQEVLKCLNGKFKGGYVDREYTAAQLEAVIEGMSGDDKLIGYAKKSVKRRKEPETKRLTQ